VDTVKIFLAMLVLFGVSLIIMKGKTILLFWLGIFLLFSRRVHFPVLGDLEPSTVILYFTAILVLPRILPILINKFYLQLAVLILGLAVGALSNRPAEDYWTWSIAIFSIYLFSALSEFYIRDEKALERLSTLFIVISFIIAFTAVLAFAGFADNVIILSDNTTSAAEEGAVLYSKTYGIAYSNSVNGFIPMSLIFLYSKKWNKILRLIIFCAITASVFISLKRIAYLSLGFTILYIIFRDGKPKIKVILLLVLLLAGGLFFFGREIGERFQNTENVLAGEESPDANRTMRLEYGWKRYLEHPVIGNGSGSVIYIHNGFFEILINLGLPGLIIIIPWVLKPARLLFLQQDKRINDWAISCLIYLGTLFLFEAVLNRLDIFWIFGLFFAGMECAYRIGRQEVMKEKYQPWETDRLALP
jgi:hypothetical protein